MLFPDVSWVNFIVGWTLLAWSKKRLRFSSDSVHFMSSRLWNETRKVACEVQIVWLVFSSFRIKMLAYASAIFVPTAVPLICKKCSPLNVKLLCFSTNVSNWTRHSVCFTYSKGLKCLTLLIIETYTCSNFSIYYL